MPIVVDARRRYEYNAGHIPGAINLRWEQWCEAAPQTASQILHQPGWWGKLAEVPQVDLESKMGLAGLAHDRQIVVYANGAKSKGRDARIAWMLLYYGAKEVYILNGGWSAWIDVDGDVETQLRHPETSVFQIDLDAERRVTLEDILKSGRYTAIDTRTPEEYRGVIYDYQPRLGRIPGSLNVPFASLYEETEVFLTQSEFTKSTFVESAIDEMADQAQALNFSYCEVGVRAATFSLLFELYRGEKLPVYDGSFMEWSFHGQLPLECD